MYLFIGNICVKLRVYNIKLWNVVLFKNPSYDEQF